MSTRGTWGYVIDGEEKLTYNHSDSYPSWLGKRILSHVEGADLADLKERVRALQMVSEATPPSAEDVARCEAAGVANYNVGTQREDDWYCLLRETQGDPDTQLEAGMMVDGSNFPQDSLFCEWAYVIDLDHERLEVYAGFQTEPHAEGRFAGHPPINETGTDFYPVRLIAVYALRELPDEETMTALEELETVS